MSSRVPASPGLSRAGSSSDASTENLRGSFISEDILNYEPPSTAEGRAKLRSSFGGSGLTTTPSPHRQAAAWPGTFSAENPAGMGGAYEGEVFATATLYTVTMRSDMPVVNGAFCITISDHSLVVNVKSDMSVDATVLMARSLTLPPDAIPTQLVSSFHDGIVKVQIARSAHGGGSSRSKLSPGAGPVDTKALTRNTEEMMAELSNILETSSNQRFQPPTLPADQASQPPQNAADGKGELEGNPALQIEKPGSKVPAKLGERLDSTVLHIRTPCASDCINSSQRQHTDVFTNDPTNAANVNVSPGSPALRANASTLATMEEAKADRRALRRDLNVSLLLPSPLDHSSAATADSPSKGQAADSDVLKRCQNLLKRSKEQSKKLLEDVAWPITPEGQARAGYAGYGFSSRVKESVPLSDHSTNPKSSFDSQEHRTPNFEPPYSSPDTQDASYEAPAALHTLRQSAPGRPAIMMQGTGDIRVDGSFRSPSPARNLNSNVFDQSPPAIRASNREAPHLLGRYSGADVVFM